jgi:hypothetical protein
MKSFLATTAIVLLMGGSAYAAPAQFNTYQSKATDVDASKFIGQTVYASKTDVTPDQKVTADGQKDWDNIGDINELVLSQDGSVKAVVIGVGGFLGMGEKNVAVSMKDIKFVKTGDGADDYSLVINSTKEALNAAPAYKTPDDVKAAMNSAKTTDTTTTAANPGLTAPADNNTAANTTTTTDMAKPADTAKDTAADTTMTTDKAANTTAADTTMKKPADTATNQASNTATTTDNNAASTDTTTTASTTNNDNAVTTTMNDNRARLTAPSVTREGYQAAKVEELTSDKLEGATVYGPKDEDVGKVNKLVMNDNGKGVKLFVLDVGGFLGIGAHQIAVTPQELDIVRNAKGDDVRVYIDANKDALKAQPEYKTQ